MWEAKNQTENKERKSSRLGYHKSWLSRTFISSSSLFSPLHALHCYFLLSLFLLKFHLSLLPRMQCCFISNLHVWDAIFFFFVKILKLYWLSVVSLIPTPRRYFFFFPYHFLLIQFPPDLSSIFLFTIIIIISMPGIFLLFPIFSLLCLF